MKLTTIDTSVIVAILLGEPNWKDLERVILSCQPLMSSASIVEAFLVLRPRLGEVASDLLDQAIQEYQIAISDFRRLHVSVAEDAFERYGKGRHPAKLNFGDCIVYATAKVSNTPLLFLGNDFILTDIEAVRIP